MSGKISCGIDFGTSNSTLAIAREKNKTLVPLEDDKTTLPSAIFFKQDTAPLFGRKGIAAYIDGEDGRLMRGLKKILGTPLMEEKTIIGNKAVAFTDILKAFIVHMKDKADSFANQNIENIVIGRPVHFHDDNYEADIKSQNTLENIAYKAGFKNIEFLFEPIAAAFAHEAKFADEKLSIVIDLGGGTSDFTIIKICNKNVLKADRRDDILATGGVRIGGTTFDYRLSLHSFMPALGLGTKFHDLFDSKKLMPVPMSVYRTLSDWALVHHAQNRKALADTADIKRRALSPEKLELLYKLQQNHLGHALLEQVESTKIALTHNDKHSTLLKDLDPHLFFQTARKEFEHSISEDIHKIFNCIQNCLITAQINNSDIDLVILTGGSTELPIINTLVREMFPEAMISQGDKLDSVGLGLAYRAANIF